MRQKGIFIYFLLFFFSKDLKYVKAKLQVSSCFASLNSFRVHGINSLVKHFLSLT